MTYWNTLHCVPNNMGFWWCPPCQTLFCICSYLLPNGASTLQGLPYYSLVTYEIASDPALHRNHHHTSSQGTVWHAVGLGKWSQTKQENGQMGTTAPIIGQFWCLYFSKSMKWSVYELDHIGPLRHGFALGSSRGTSIGNRLSTCKPATAWWSWA